ncbi:hypothetical protein QA601_15750 [Chitinispirillales bacterium ANBcel5]|nr:hypothetical protein [Chitinispirillales bacterium ANBcel5]
MPHNSESIICASTVPFVSAQGYSQGIASVMVASSASASTPVQVQEKD